jgi:thimet oligopeptidase
MPLELIERMNRAGAFGRAGYVSTQDAYSAISYELYRGDPKDADPDTITENALDRFSFSKLSPDTHMWASFGHLGGYSSAYYTYMWDEVIALDFFAQFDRGNPLSGSAPARYRRLVLEPGGSMSANDLVKNFLGRPQNMNALQHWMGQEFSASSSAAAGSN